MTEAVADGCVRVAFDVRAQLCVRAGLDRSVRQLGLDRSISVKRVGHAIDDAGFENCVGVRLFERRALRPGIFGAYDMLWLGLARLDSRGRFAFEAFAGAGFRRPYGIEVLAPGRRTRRLRPEQEVKPRGLQSLDGSAARTIFRRILRFGWRSFECARLMRLKMRAGIRRERNLLLISNDRSLGFLLPRRARWESL